MFKVKNKSKIIKYILPVILLVAIIFVFTACGTDDSVALDETDYKYIDTIYNNMSLWESDDDQGRNDFSCTSFGIYKYDDNIYFATFYQTGATEEGMIGNESVSSKTGYAKYYILTENNLEIATDITSKRSKSLYVVSAYCKYRPNGTTTEKYDDIKAAYIQYKKR